MQSLQKPKVNRLLHGPKRRQGFHVYSQESINLVNSRVTTLQVVGEFVKLKITKNGDGVGRCPFCKPVSKKGNQFRVSAKLGIFKCFNCGKAGRATGFIKEYFSIPFDRAISFINYTFLKDNKVNLEVIGKKKQRGFECFRKPNLFRAGIYGNGESRAIKDDDDLPF